MVTDGGMTLIMNIGKMGKENNIEVVQTKVKQKLKTYILNNKKRIDAYVKQFNTNTKHILY